ncbi:MAG: TonB-dependent receptor plug domain-containing protein [Deltaproteobacteria bacterium]|nr:TonB-dependent receptor plug domain-containing protein [Deltaproteobacteria bacterium]
MPLFFMLLVTTTSFAGVLVFANANENEDSEPTADGENDASISESDAGIDEVDAERRALEAELEGEWGSEGEVELELELEGELESVTEEEAAKAELEGTIVTSSRVDKGGKATATDVVDEDALKERNARTLADALAQEAGIQLGSNRGLGDTLTIDGMDGKYVLVLVDGQPVNGKVDDRTDLSRLGLSAAQVQKVEVVRGPMSALYGSEAMGGVINIITKKPRPGTHGAVELFGSSGEKSWLDAGGSGRVSMSFGPAQFAFDFSYLRKNAVDQATPETDADPWLGTFATQTPDGASDLPHRQQGSLRAVAKLLL